MRLGSRVTGSFLMTPSVLSQMQTVDVSNLTDAPLHVKSITVLMYLMDL
jgi:hypothetical protein